MLQIKTDNLKAYQKEHSPDVKCSTAIVLKDKTFEFSLEIYKGLDETAMVIGAIESENTFNYVCLARTNNSETQTKLINEFLEYYNNREKIYKEWKTNLK